MKHGKYTDKSPNHYSYYFGGFYIFGGIKYHAIRLSDFEVEVVGVTDNLLAEEQQVESGEKQ